MELQELYRKITDINFRELAYKNGRVLKDTKLILPDIQNFLLEISEIRWEEDASEYVKNDILHIMKDIVDAYDNEDKVLLMDATAYGVQKYLRLFLPENMLEDDE